MLVLSTDARQYIDPITYETIPMNDAYYFAPNVHKNTIHTLYGRNTIEHLLTQRAPKSPITRRPITPADVRRHALSSVALQELSFRRQQQQQKASPYTHAIPKAFRLKTKNRVIKRKTNSPRKSHGTPMNWEYTPNYMNWAPTHAPTLRTFRHRW